MHPDAFKAMYTMESGYWWFCAKREYIRQVINRHLPVENKAHFAILDCGCGTGNNLAFLSQFGTVLGIDNSDNAIDYCTRNGFKKMVKKANISDLSIFYDSFDLVTALDVLYHRSIKDDVAVLKEFHRVLKSNGWLLLTDSAYNFLKSSHDIAVETRERYTLKTMGNRLQQSGFAVIHQTYTYLVTFPFVLIVRLLKKSIWKPIRTESDVKPVSPILNSLLVRLLRWEARFALRYRLPMGSSILILARKI